MAKRFIEQPEESSGEVEMPFGKYRGRKLKDISTNYLEWLSGQVAFSNNDLAEAVADQLMRRSGEVEGYEETGGDGEAPSSFDMEMPFGKFKGQRLGDIPLKNLIWMEKNLTMMRPNLRSAIREVIIQLESLEDEQEMESNGY